MRFVCLSNLDLGILHTVDPFSQELLFRFGKLTRPRYQGYLKTSADIDDRRGVSPSIRLDDLEQSKDAVQLPHQDLCSETMSTTSSGTAIVLAHGAYHTSWHLQTLKAELEKYGYHVLSPDLPSAGHLATLENDVDTLKDAILRCADTHERVLPVLHSYAGVPGTEAIAELLDTIGVKIPRVIYLAALVLPQGSALSGPNRDDLSPWIVTRHGFCAVPSAKSTFFNDASPELAEDLAARVVIHSQLPFDTPTKHAGWTQYPGTYVVFSDDRALPAAATDTIWDRIRQTDKQGSWKLEKLPGSHCPFVTRARELAQFIHSEAQAPSAN